MYKSLAAGLSALYREQSIKAKPGPATPVALQITQSSDACPADFNNDDVINSQGFFDFLTAYFAGF